MFVLSTTPIVALPELADSGRIWFCCVDEGWYSSLVRKAAHGMGRLLNGRRGRSHRG